MTEEKPNCDETSPETQSVSSSLDKPVNKKKRSLFKRNSQLNSSFFLSSAITIIVLLLRAQPEKDCDLFGSIIRLLPFAVLMIFLNIGIFTLLEFLKKLHKTNKQVGNN
jgi:hypothetical protein